MNKKRTRFPKGFFTKIRPEENLKDALEDVIPVEWISITPNDKKATSNNIKITNRK